MNKTGTVSVNKVRRGNIFFSFINMTVKKGYIFTMNGKHRISRFNPARLSYNNKQAGTLLARQRKKKGRPLGV